MSAPVNSLSVFHMDISPPVSPIRRETEDLQQIPAQQLMYLASQMPAFHAQEFWGERDVVDLSDEQNFSFPASGYFDSSDVDQEIDEERSSETYSQNSPQREADLSEMDEEELDDFAVIYEEMSFSDTESEFSL